MFSVAAALCSAALVAADPCPPATAACAKDPNCAAFGVHGKEYQLHGCADKGALVPNKDWTIYVPTSPNKSAYKPLGQKVNVDEGKCPTHPQKAASWFCAPESFPAVSSVASLLHVAASNRQEQKEPDQLAMLQPGHFFRPPKAQDAPPRRHPHRHRTQCPCPPRGHMTVSARSTSAR
jgi:hypothetical protein